MEIVTTLDQLAKTSILRATSVSKLIGESGPVINLVENRCIFLEKSAHSDDYEAWVAFRDYDNRIKTAPLIEYIVNPESSDSSLMDDGQIALFARAGGQVKPFEVPWI
jgi:hypothetical protein